MHPPLSMGKGEFLETEKMGNYSAVKRKKTTGTGLNNCLVTTNL